MRFHKGLKLVAITEPRKSLRGHASQARAILSSLPPAEPTFLALFESSGEALLVLDSGGSIQWANKKARELLRLPAAQTRGRGLGNLLRDSHIEKKLSRLWSGGKATVPRSLHSTLRAGAPVRVTLRAILPGAGHLLVCLDEESGERNIQSKFAQTEKMAALGQLVSGIAHELNNPLTAIMGYAQLLLGHGLKPAQLAEASKVYQEAERARRIVRSLLYFTRENQPERSRADLNEIIERTLALRSYELRVENIQAQCDLDPTLPLTLADPTQLQQVVLNLLVNAEQALLEGRGEGRVWIRTRHVPATERSAPAGWILLEVADDGMGVPPAIASRIFDPFFTTKPPGVGTGLGLSIVYGIVQQHGGEVSLESPPNGGARFVVKLPVMALPADARTVSASAQTESGATISPCRILVIEDEPSVAQLIADVLREEGHRAETALDSKEGLTRLSRSHYHLVVCDLRMPVLDGEAVFDALRRAGSPLRNRILFVTGDVLAPKTLHFLERNRLPYLTKPFLVEELKLAVSRLLESAIRHGARPERTVVLKERDAEAES